MWTTGRTFAKLCVAFLAKFAAVQAQGVGIGSVPGNGTCDLGGLPGAIDTVNARCCADEQCTCPTPCSSALLPLLDTCRPVLDALLDMDDGVEDGVAGMLDVIKYQCLATPSVDVLGELKEMRNNGTCPNELLNDVAQTEVTEAPCADSGRVKCAALLLAGLTCGDTDMVTNCMSTCNMCRGHHHRRAQITVRCQDFAEKAEAVNAACCDSNGCSGVPTTCDAKCAIVYNDFFDQCVSQLENNIHPAEIQAWRNLHTTCSSLPVEPLLRAVIACQVQPSLPLGHAVVNPFRDSNKFTTQISCPARTTPGAFVPPPPPSYGGFGAVGTPAGPGTGLNSPQCHAGLEKMTSLSLNNGPVAASQGSTIAVYPVSMHFMDGQCFCQELGGHLASITDEIDFQALQTATRSSGVKSAVFIGAHEISEGQWMNTDGTPANLGLLESHGWCTQSKQGGLDGYDCEKNFDNHQHNEDTMAWCNEACITRHGWDGHVRPGLHDWGNSQNRDTYEHVACKFAQGVNPAGQQFGYVPGRYGR